MSYVYEKIGPDHCTVGFYGPDGQWTAESDWGTQDEAARRVHYLNGGLSEPDWCWVKETVEEAVAALENLESLVIAVYRVADTLKDIANVAEKSSSNTIEGRS